MRGHRDVHAPGPQAADHRVMVSQVRRTAVPPRLHQADRPAMAQEDVAERDRAPAHGRLPVAVAGRQIDLGEDEIDDAIDDLVPVGEVVVHRHPLDPEFLTQLAHAHRLEPALIGEPEGRLQHPLPAQRDAALALPPSSALTCGLLPPRWVRDTRA